jgi:hypothetical protein
VGDNCSFFLAFSLIDFLRAWPISQGPPLYRRTTPYEEGEERAGLRVVRNAVYVPEAFLKQMGVTANQILFLSEPTKPWYRLLCYHKGSVDGSWDTPDGSGQYCVMKQLSTP